MTKIQITPKYSEVKPRGFYVYLHKRATDGSIFYVGKGTGDRAWHKSSYSRGDGWWRNISIKNGVIVEICQDDMTEGDAFLLEMWLIAKLRHVGVVLCNLTDGGEGASGAVRSKETKQRLRESKTGKLNPMYGKRHTEETSSKMRNSRVGRKPSLGMRHSEENKKAASIRVSGDGNPMAKKETHEFWHKDHGMVLATTAYMRHKYNLSNNVSLLVSGKLLTCKGWRMYSRLDEKPYDFSLNCRKVSVRSSKGEVYDTMSEAARDMVRIGYKGATQSSIWYACKTPGKVSFDREWFRND